MQDQDHGSVSDLTFNRYDCAGQKCPLVDVEAIRYFELNNNGARARFCPDLPMHQSLIIW